MLLYLFILLTINTQKMNPIFVFNHDCKLENWQVVDDIVMGGRSNGQLSLNSYGNGVFKEMYPLKIMADFLLFNST